MLSRTQQARTAIPLAADARVDPERLARMWCLTADEREAAARRGDFSLGELLAWAARRPQDIALVDGEFWFLTALAADNDVGNENR